MCMVCTVHSLIVMNVDVCSQVRAVSLHEVTFRKYTATM